MFRILSEIFGYILLFIYNIIPNYGIAIILFTLFIKLLMLPLSIKQQRSMKKSQELNEQVQVIQLKYKDDPTRQSQEMMKLYKENNTSPFSGCLVSIFQLILIFTMFTMVRSPLTYMEKVPQNDINQFVEELKNSNIEVSQNYPQIDVIREASFLKEKFPDNKYINNIDINMNFLGIDLTLIPQNNLNNWKVYIIPALYIVSILVSNHMMTKMQQKLQPQSKNPNEKALTNKSDDSMEDTMNQMSSMMKYMLPIASVSIALIAPLGLALYWFISNLFMIVERLVIDRFVKE